MFLKYLYIHVLINVPRLLIEKDVVDINNEILTSITINRLMVSSNDLYYMIYFLYLQVTVSIKRTTRQISTRLQIKCHVKSLKYT
jgi:hypothetical protein